MKILAIETSCDDTAISVLECSGDKNSPIFRVLANEKISQEKMHAEYGGVYPNVAKNEHTKNLPILFEQVMRLIKLPHRQDLWGDLWGKDQIDLVAVTYGPGLEPSLWTGITFAQEKAKELGIPIVPINHMEGHVWSFFGKDEGEFKMPSIKFPMLALLVSGGHTQLVVTQEFGKYKIIGNTLDDAVGEAYDKVARMLGLPYPGGPHISNLAELSRNNNSRDTISAITFPRPMMHTKDYNFSYSGLKTSVLYTMKKIEKLDEATKAQIAMEFENAAIEPIVYKTKRAVEEFGIKTLVVGGGVAANKHLREELEENIKNIPIHFPLGTALSSDNALMIGIVAWLTYLNNDEKIPKYSEIKAQGRLKLE